VKAHNSFREKLQELGLLWARYKNSGIRASLLVILVLLVIAQIYPPLQEFISSKQYLGLAIAVAMMFLLFDAIVSPTSDSRTDRSIILKHFTDLRSHLRDAFGQSVIEFDIATYSGETFYNVLTEFLQDVLEGRKHPRRLHMRMLVPDFRRPVAVPCDLHTHHEHPGYKKMIQERNKRFAVEFAHYFSDIAKRFPEMDVDFSIRAHWFPPLFKLIMMNRRIIFFGLYPISETPANLDGEQIYLWDYRGERTVMVGLSLTGTATEAQLSKEISEWFDTVWTKLSYPMDEDLDLS